MCLKVVLIYNVVDISNEELDEFIDSLTQDQFATLQSFFETMPKLRHKVEITNPNTKVKSTITLEGLSDFLD
jgi:F420-dependent methylenetetrahydromethanopterin dehydrogenase